MSSLMLDAHGAAALLSPSAGAEVWLTPREDGLSAMDRLYSRFDGMYPTRWRASFAGGEAIANWRSAWAEAFAAQDISFDEVGRALAACLREFDWPPSLPEFMRVCRPRVDAQAAWAEAVRSLGVRYTVGGDTWSHPAIFWAAVDVGSFDVMNQSWKLIESRWRRALERRLSMRCDPVPPMAMALPPPGGTTPDAAAVARLIAGAKAVLQKSREAGR